MKEVQVRMFRLLVIAPALALQGCVFFYIPGSFIDAAADTASGSKGRHCVGASAKVGDLIRLPNGSTWKVQNLEGTSYRCKDADHPIRAELVPI